MKRKIRFLSIVLSVLCFLHLPLYVLADVIYFPADPFFEEHMDECRKVNASFRANGPDGFLTVYESPLSDQEKGQIENGVAVNIRYIYDDWEKERSWGYFEEDTHGWVLMEHLEHVDKTPEEITGETTGETTQPRTSVPETTKAEKPAKPYQTEHILEYVTLGLWIAALAAVTYVLLLLLKRK